MVEFNIFRNVPREKAFAIFILALGIGYTGGRYHSDIIMNLENIVTIKEDELAELRLSKNVLDKKNKALILNIESCNTTSASANKDKSNVSITKASHKELLNRPVSCPITNQESVNLVKPTNAFKKDCLDNETPISIISNFEEYADDINEKIFTDHYAGKWSCNYTWVVSLNDRPAQKENMYWEFYASYLNKNEKRTLIWVTLKEGIKVPSWLNKGAEIKVVGKIVKAASHGLTLVEAEYERVKVD